MKKLKNNSLISLFIVFCTITVFNAPTLAALTDLDINNKAGSPTLIKDEQRKSKITQSFSAVAAPTSSGLSDSFAFQYFFHLGTNTPYNRFGSCGYVALSCVLSFYDTYWNDNIIPEQYDQNSANINISPGVKNESTLNTLTAEEYYNAIISNNYNNVYVNNYFQFLLFSLAKQKNNSYISLNTDNKGEKQLACGVNFSKMVTIINTYLYEYLNFTTDECELITIEKSDSDSLGNGVKEFTINYLKQGYPVIVGIPGHVTVAYDYYEPSDTVYGYWGYGEIDNHKAYTQFSDAYVIALKTGHIHSNNYDLNGTPTCSCKLSTHQHDYTYNYKKSTSQHHKATCYCGASELQPHLYKSENVVTIKGHIYATCSECRATICIDDTYIPGIITRIPAAAEELAEYAENQKF